MRLRIYKRISGEADKCTKELFKRDGYPRMMSWDTEENKYYIRPSHDPYEQETFELELTREEMNKLLSDVFERYMDDKERPSE